MTITRPSPTLHAPTRHRTQPGNGIVGFAAALMVAAAGTGHWSALAGIVAMAVLALAVDWAFTQLRREPAHGPVTVRKVAAVTVITVTGIALGVLLLMVITEVVT